jgi:8-oxo-dGTP diphosphatase
MKREDQGDGRLSQYRLVPRTLCFVFHGDEVLLLKGAPTKRLWANLYNGIGGHVDSGEDVASAARREIREETGLEVDQLRLRGVVTIDVEPLWGIGLYVFSAQAGGCQLSPSPDGELAWFPPSDLPVSEVVEDLPTLLQRVISAAPTDPPFCAHYCFDSKNQLVAHFAA